MNAHGNFKQLSGGNLPAGGSLLGRVLAFVIGSAALVGALLVSAVLFVVLAAVGVLLGTFLWWKTRGLRRQMREQMQQMEQAMQAQRDAHGARDSQDAPAGTVIEGEYVRERGTEDRR